MRLTPLILAALVNESLGFSNLASPSVKTTLRMRVVSINNIVSSQSAPSTPFVVPRELSAADAATLHVLNPPTYSSVPIIRAFGVVSLFAAWASQAKMNTVLAAAWEAVRTTAWFRHDMFEPVVAVSSFFVFIHAWLGVDWLASSGRLPGLRKYQIVPKALIVENGGDGTERSRQRLTRWHYGWYKELAVYLLPLWALASFTDAFAPRRRALAMAAPTAARVAKEILGGLFFYDLFFAVTHAGLHRLRLPSWVPGGWGVASTSSSSSTSSRRSPSPVFQRLHGKHHANADIRACDTVRLTTVEETIDVVCSIAALRVMGAHPLSRSLYNVVIIFLLAELHSGYDMPWSPQNVVPGGLVAGSRRHHAHHADGAVFYQKFLTYFDDAFGFTYRNRRGGEGSKQGEAAYTAEAEALVA